MAACSRWPALRDLLRVQVDTQLGDLRTLLCLPRQAEPGFEAGCNLTAATLAFNIVAGARRAFRMSSAACRPHPREGRLAI